MSLTLIETKTLLSAAASIEFTSIPQDGTDLVALISARSSGADGTRNCQVIPNGYTSGYTTRALYGEGSGSGASYSSTLIGYVGEIPASAVTANTFGSILVYYPNYSGSTNKSISIDNVTEDNATYSRQDLMAGLWSNTSAITSLLVKTNAAMNLVAGSTVSLYKITKGSSGGVVVS
jgi:hypothetical protein